MSSSRFVEDLSQRDRLGLAGLAANSVLHNLLLAPPDTRFACTQQPDGSLLVKLDATEFLWLDGPHRQDPPTWRDSALTDSGDCYLIHWRSSHAWFSMTGARSTTTLAELCALDLHPAKFHNLTCAATMLARIPILLVRWDAGEQLQFHLLIPRPHAATVLDWLELRQRESMTHD